MSIEEAFELPYGDEYPKPIFARYAPNFIQVKRTRKRAIARARHATKMKTIEIGDTVEVIDSYFECGFEVGTIGVVTEIRDSPFSVVKDVRVSVYMAHIDHTGYRIHKKTDLKLIKKGSN